MLLDKLFTVHQFNRVWLLVAEYNAVAINLYKNLGFRLEGTQREAIYRFGQFWNYETMSILKRSY